MDAPDHFSGHFSLCIFFSSHHYSSWNLQGSVGPEEFMVDFRFYTRQFNMTAMIKRQLVCCKKRKPLLGEHINVSRLL